VLSRRAVPARWPLACALPARVSLPRTRRCCPPTIGGVASGSSGCRALRSIEAGQH
jgi:hypothetical protein